MAKNYRKDKSKKTYEKEDENFRSDRDASRKFKDSKKGRNDPSWYTGNDQLAKDAGNFSFTWPVGNPVDLEYNQSVSGLPTLTISELNNADGKSKFALPGVMAIRFVPTVGMSTDNSSVVNVAAHNIYTFVRHANSGHSNYDAPDLMMYLLSMDQIYMMYSHIVRLYGTLALYSQRNRNVPKLLVEAMGFDFDDVIMHMSDLRYYINQTALKINSFAVPATMAYFTRHYWLCKNVYKDADDPKAQLYVFVPECYGKYQELNGAGYLSAEFFNNWSTTQKKYADIVTIMDGLLNAVIYSEDMNIMSGDILKAYGENSLFAVPQIPAEYIVLPQYVPEVLGQIHNTVLAGNPGFTNGKFIDQDPNTNALLSTLTLSHYWGTATMQKRIMSAFSVNPTEDEVLVNSRLMVAGPYEIVNASGSLYPLYHVLHMVPESVGSEVATYATIYKWDTVGGITSYDFDMTMAMIVQAGNTFTNANRNWSRPKYALRAALSAFNFHPMVIWSQEHAVTATTDIANWDEITASIDFDVDNYAILDAHDLAKMHETSLLSLFNVPQMGR